VTQPPPTTSLGPNAWLVDEMYERFVADPTAVSESWRDFFADYRAETAVPAAPANAPALAPAPANGAASRPPDAPAARDDEGAGQPLKGAAAAIAANMERSLEVPTATSFREVPAKLLEVNRRVVNNHLARTRGGKVSFTHIIGYAAVRAVARHVPVMNNSYVTGADDRGRLVRPEHVNVGIAVDVENPDGTRSLMVPVIKAAETLDFRAFVGAYEDLIRRVRSRKLQLADLQGATISLTNPGTIGTVQSVPRLMRGQGLIVGVGRIGFPAAFDGADPDALARLGLSKTVTITSTYDHRIIQGAESGQFLAVVHELLLGEHGFYEDLFASMDLPYTAVAWRRDVNPDDADESALEKQTQVQQLVNIYRVRGHLIADLDPLRMKPPHMEEELDPATYGLTIWDLDRHFLTGGLGGQHSMTLRDMLGVLRDAYCRTIGIEYMHIQEPAEKRWIQSQVEVAPRSPAREDQLHILDRLNAAEALEKFLGARYIAQKRFGIEGAESAIPLLDAVLSAAADAGLDSAVLGMAHRGRLNVLVNIVGKSYGQLFREFEGYVDPDTVQGSGDVKYHLGQQGTFVARSGRQLPIHLAANPSHLEAVDPVVVGMARARMDQIDPTEVSHRVPADDDAAPGGTERFPVLPVLVHGDAAFAGQGVVAETLNLSNIRGYRAGGTIHLVINNQVGFTTSPEHSRSSHYSTDVAKMVQAPIFHVNGDDPEACVRVAELAFRYRQRFCKDVVIDMVCYRRFGHNETDDPSYTQPEMYRRIDATRSVRKIYTEALVKRGDITLEDAEAALDDFQAKLQLALEETRQAAPESPVVARPPQLVGVLPQVPTAVSEERLERVYEALTSLPADFTVHPKLARQFAARDKMFRAGQVDWALGEAFALGTLLADGTSVRLAGQDSRRGTFSHRHSVLIDYERGTEHVPLDAVAAGGGSCLWIYDSLLSEYAALGFEYGYSVVNKSVLVMWEAQFGDFANGAQIIIDQFVVAAEDKWGQTSGLVLLLPHGYEGQGPEHSSARIERFLVLAAEDNIQVATPTTSAQFFHLLRRQMLREVRKPLVVFTPKSLLRAKFSQSPVEAFTRGTFDEVVDDAGVDEPRQVRRVALCAGKVAADLFDERERLGGRADVAIVRVEQLYPWPREALAAVLGRYDQCSELMWVQEEPRNMGAWNSIKENLFEHHADRHRVVRVSRVESGSPASGSGLVHEQEKAEILAAVFAPAPS